MPNSSVLNIESALPDDSRFGQGERHFAEILRDGILVTNEAFHTIWMNSALREMLGIKHPVQAMNVADVLQATGTPYHAIDEMLDSCRQNSRWKGNAFIYQDSIAHETSLEVIKDGNRWIFFFGDVQSRNLAENRWRQETKMDPLTRMPNRSAFHDHLMMAIATAEYAMEYVTVMLIDLDRFQIINDGLGYTVGDALLKACAHRIKGALSGPGTVFRLGGDEFVVVLSGTSREDARTQADIIKKAMELPYAVDERELSISCSIGVSFYPDNGHTASELLKHSDVALYHSKQNGRNCVSLYHEEMSERAARKFEIENALKSALQKGEFRLEYQIQVDVSRSRICGAEALIRWEHPQLGRVPPDQFIPRAEEMRLMGLISDWVFETAVMQLAEWHRDGVQIPKVAINLSATQLTDLTLPDRLIGMAVRHGVNPAFIELELTESSMMEDMDRCLTILRGLRKVGFRIAVDDFGTGHSSLRYLKFLPISKIKIDRAFIQGIPFDEGDIALTKTIITLAKSMNMDVLAEGVETMEQMNYLWVNNCVEIQGYAFSRPVPPQNIESAIANALNVLAGKV